MKKSIFYLLFLALCNIATNAQIWVCDSISDDIRIFNKYKGSNKKQAEQAMLKFPLNSDNELQMEYVYYCSDSIPRLELKALTEGWLGTVFTNANKLIEVSDSNHTICEGQWGLVGWDQKFIGATKVNAPVEIVVLYKENRLKLRILTRNFTMAYANVGTLESGTVSIGSVFPFNKKANHKDAFAMAFLNSISKSLNLANSFLKYLNKHTNEELENDKW